MLWLAWLGWLLALASCDQVFGLDGRSAPATDAVDAVTVCVRDQVTGGPNDDQDMDGIPNLTDACPITATKKDPHNEDADCRGDECDPCPHLAEPTNDSDGDGIGDLCDFRTGFDLATFDSFTNADEFITAGGWTILPGSDQYESPAGDQASIRNVETAQNGLFETVIELPEGDTFDVGLLFGLTDTTVAGDGYGVLIGRTGGGLHELRLYKVNAGVSTLLSSMVVAALQPGTPYVLNVRIEIRDVTVTLSSPTDRLVWTATLPTVLPTLSYYGLVTSLPTRFGYLFRVEPQ